MLFVRLAAKKQTAFFSSASPRTNLLEKKFPWDPRRDRYNWKESLFRMTIHFFINNSLSWKYFFLCVLKTKEVKWKSESFQEFFQSEFFFYIEVCLTCLSDSFFPISLYSPKVLFYLEIPLLNSIYIFAWMAELFDECNSCRGKIPKWKSFWQAKT